MYHTFQSASAEAKNAAGASSGSKRISTSNACTECRRRKIRCDGGHPCQQCQWYHRAESCTYSKGTPRLVPSRKYDGAFHLVSSKIKRLG